MYVKCSDVPLNSPTRGQPNEVSASMSCLMWVVKAFNHVKIHLVITAHFSVLQTLCGEVIGEVVFLMERWPFEYITFLGVGHYEAKGEVTPRSSVLTPIAWIQILCARV